MKRDEFFRLGGYDEGFVGWGGEDNEFFNRCAAIGHMKFGSVPFVHLWHVPQSDKHVSDNKNITHAIDQRLSMPVKDRIAELSQRNFGNPAKPDPTMGYSETL